MGMSAFVRISAAVLLLSFASMTAAANLVVNGTGQLTGATGVLVDGRLYDVTIADGTCAALFNGCDNPSDFAFASPQASIDASQALLDQVLINSAAGFFDRDYDLTIGCGINNEGDCNVLVPYEMVNGNFDAYGAANTPLTPNGIALPDDDISFTNASITYDTSVDDALTWAIFKPAVPEASTWTMMLLGFGAIGFAIRRKRKAQLAVD